MNNSQRRKFLRNVLYAADVNFMHTYSSCRETSAQVDVCKQFSNNLPKLPEIFCILPQRNLEETTQPMFYSDWNWIAIAHI